MSVQTPLLFRKSIFLHFAGQKMAFVIHSLGQVAPSSHRGDGADASGQPPKHSAPHQALPQPPVSREAQPAPADLQSNWKVLYYVLLFLRELEWSIG